MEGAIRKPTSVALDDRIVVAEVLHFPGVVNQGFDLADARIACLDAAAASNAKAVATLLGSNLRSQIVTSRLGTRQRQICPCGCSQVRWTSNS